VAKSKGPKVPRRKRGVGDDVPPVVARTSRHRTKIAGALFGLAWERRLGHKDKLYALKMACRNVRPALDQVCHRAPDPALARSDAAVCLAEIIGELGVTLAHLTRIEER
jgi:hypothetical protein